MLKDVDAFPGVSPGPPVRFPGRQVERHANHVDQVAEIMADTRFPVRDVSMDTSAYGMLCQFLRGMLNPVFGQGVDALNRSADALHETAVALRSTATDMRRADEAADIRFGSRR